MIPVSVNFAGATLRQEGLADKMLHLIEKHHVRCEYLEVEVSESSSDMNQEMLAETSSKIRKGNVRVILDHFGAKDSSFSILSLMEFDGLKLKEPDRGAGCYRHMQTVGSVCSGSGRGNSGSV